MRKYLMNIGVLSAAFSGFGLLRATAKGPRNWRLGLLWAGWIVSMILALGTVAEDSRDSSNRLTE